MLSILQSQLMQLMFQIFIFLKDLLLQHLTRIVVHTWRFFHNYIAAVVWVFSILFLLWQLRLIWSCDIRLTSWLRLLNRVACHWAVALGTLCNIVIFLLSWITSQIIVIGIWGVFISLSWIEYCIWSTIIDISLRFIL